MYLEPLIPDLVSPFSSFRERAATSASRPRRFALASPTSRTLHCDGCNHLALGTRSARLCIHLLLVLTVGRVRLLRPPDMEKNSEANSSQPSPHPCCMLPSLQGSNPRSPLLIDAPPLYRNMQVLGWESLMLHLRSLGAQARRRHSQRWAVVRESPWALSTKEQHPAPWPYADVS